MRYGLLGGFALVAPSLALGGVSSVDLANYQLTATYSLPAVAAAEASAVTYNWDTDSLFVLGDEGDAIVEVNRQGQQLSAMALTGFADTEGLTYTGNGRFVITEERIQTAYSLNYSANGTADRSALPSAVLGGTVGNIGIEGVSYDPRNGNYVLVKEKTPQRVISASFDFSSAPIVNDLFPPNLGVSDLSDVAVLSTVAGGSADEDNLLIYSQESQRLLEVDRLGNILSQFDFSSIAFDAEGVTIDQNGVIYVVGETPAMYVLTPIPEPGTAVLLLVAAGIFARRSR